MLYVKSFHTTKKTSWHLATPIFFEGLKLKGTLAKYIYVVEPDICIYIYMYLDLDTFI